MCEEESKYNDRTNLLMNLRANAERQFDKQIIYLSAGGLVFSVGFVKDIIGVNSLPQCKFLLIASWICFATALVVNLFSYISSRNAIDNELIKKESLSSIFNKITIILNWISIFGLIFGLFFLIIFSILNF